MSFFFADLVVRTDEARRAFETHPVVLDAVARSEADFGINFMGSQEPDIDFVPLLEERFVAGCRRDHPLANKRRAT